jgi:hypothetical protein
MSIDPLAAVIAIASLISAIYFFLRQREKRHFDYQFISVNALLQEGASSVGLKVSYSGKPAGDPSDKPADDSSGKPVDDPYLIVLRFINTGNRPITPDDFKTSVKVQFSDSCNVLFAERIASKPPDLTPEVTAESHGAALKSSLFNPGDWVDIKLLVDGDPSERSVTGRVIGVSELRPYEPRQTPQLASSIAFVVIGALFGLLTNYATQEDPGPWVWYSGSALVLASSGIAWALYRWRQRNE